MSKLLKAIKITGSLFTRFIKNPAHFIRNCSAVRVRKALYLIKNGNFDNLREKLDMYVPSTGIERCPVEIEPVPEIFDEFSVPSSDSPKVSIIIPAYNQFAFTYKCIRKVAENSGDVAYEVIVADDTSTDETREIENIIGGIKVIHNKKNLRFLYNCNNAAATARGEYILFLNNDTQVQENWLAPLIELIESDEKIGMVGSKLIFSDGKLQEAGGIIWNNALGYNYGRGGNPSSPEFNYVKECDYVSGASIMIRRALWEEIGGFDTRFAPAYYEDTDLAFEVRRHGYKVMYQPESVVVHYEGISNGTDISSGIKSYQDKNCEKFYKKWKKVLITEQNPECVDFYTARDRSQNKKTVLIIDHYIPTYDKDAGSRSMDTYINLLLKMGFNVKLIGDNFYYDPYYGRHYEQKGVEILCGDYYMSNWKKWVTENRDKLDIVFLTRPHIARNYIDFIKENTSAKIVYYVQDLHFLRELREYEITKDVSHLKDSETLKEWETDIMVKSDTVLTLSSVEKRIIDEMIPGDKAVVMPIACYYDFSETPVSLKGKKDIIFVGGFMHRPNENGVLWFIDKVWSKVKDKLPGARLVIIGSHPTEKVLSLAENGDIEVTGFISDEELLQRYASARLCIIPLLYGAGVKGKTLEAMYNRVPIVSTSVGIEGLAGIENYVAPSDGEKAFADRLVELYNDDEKSEETAEKYYEYLKATHSFEAVRAIFERVFTTEVDENEENGADNGRRNRRAALAEKP